MSKMSDKMYVISAMVKNHYSKEIEWQYFQYENGSYGSGYPCFSFRWSAKTFATPEDAENEFKRVKKDILNKKDIIPGTLAIRAITFKYMKGLSLK